MIQFDHIDARILDLLQTDARLTNKEIADKIGKTVTPVYERIKWLEEEGFIQRYVAVLDRNKIDKNQVAFTNVQLKEHSHPMLKAFEKDIVRFPEIMECYHMTGLFDYLLKIVVKDMNEYHGFIVNKLSKLPNIGTVQSSFMMTEIKHETAYTISIPEKKAKK
jgi:DNA-binding Lrp family transcriptional regulator